MSGSLEVIYRALERLHGERTFLELTPTAQETSLIEIRAYRVAEAPAPHWHLVSVGLTELEEKVSGDPDISGFGVELTLRVPFGQRDDDRPPRWAPCLVDLLVEHMPRHRFAEGATILLEEHFLSVSTTTGIRGVAFARDPSLPVNLETPTGRCRFLQAVGVTGDELEAMRVWSPKGFVELMAAIDPMLTTGLDRHTHLRDAGFAAEVTIRTAREGSSRESLVAPDCFAVRGPGLFRRGAVLRIFESALVDELGAMVRGRLDHGRGLTLHGRGGLEVVFRRVAEGEGPCWSMHKKRLELALSPQLLDDFCGALVRRPSVRSFPALERFELHIDLP